MTRRTLLASLAGAFAGGYAAGEVEKLLWTPGKKLISIPAPRIVPPIEFLRGMQGGYAPGDLISFAGLFPTEPYVFEITARTKDGYDLIRVDDRLRRPQLQYEKTRWVVRPKDWEFRA